MIFSSNFTPLIYCHFSYTLSQMPHGEFHKMDGGQNAEKRLKTNKIASVKESEVAVGKR
jgi:hypothetical protein